MALRQPPILINPINRAKPRPVRDPHSTLRHRYNYGLMYKDIWEPDLFGQIYNAKQHMEYADAFDFIRTIMREFVEQREDKSRDRIMESIRIIVFKTDLLADTFFVIDYGFLMNKFRLNRDGDLPRKASKIHALINDVLLPSYKAVICIQDTLNIMIKILLYARSRLEATIEEPVRSVLDIIIDEDLIEEIANEDDTRTFNEVWENDESAFPIPGDVTITPLMVIEYYVHKLNKLVAKLHYYKISINETLITPLNQGLKSLNNSLKLIYNYDPKWLIVVENMKKTRSFTLKKSKSGSTKRGRSI
jgi:hypothetical protein|uniref:Uncharacterized protein n=1 Tax=viral metagenome TaxID=1070528 RepID=A0A6C0CDC2_9ZZZZ